MGPALDLSTFPYTRLFTLTFFFSLCSVCYQQTSKKVQRMQISNPYLEKYLNQLLSKSKFVGQVCKQTYHKTNKEGKLWQGARPVGRPPYCHRHTNIKPLLDLAYTLRAQNTEKEVSYATLCLVLILFLTVILNESMIISYVW